MDPRLIHAAEQDEAEAAAQFASLPQASQELIVDVACDTTKEIGSLSDEEQLVCRWLIRAMLCRVCGTA